MQTRIFHGNLTPADFARALIAEFNRGELRAQGLGDENEIIVQIATRDRPRSGGPTALTISLRAVEDGIAVQIGKQDWIGVAASLGQTALRAWRNPFSLIERLDDLAQDLGSLQLSERAWDVIENTATTLGATFELSERLRRLVCEYCLVANPVGEASCLACGAPLGQAQPRTCANCGFVIRRSEAICPNCKRPLQIDR